MGFSHVDCNLFSKFFGFQFCLLQEFISDINQGISWPGVEPINASRIDNTRELSSPDSHEVSNWRETKDNFKKFFHSIVEVTEKRINVVWDTVSFSLVS